MPYDEFLSDRIRRVLQEKKVRFDEKKMMGGLCFMVDDKMCAGVSQSRLMARVNPAQYDEFLSETGAKQMDFTGRPMKGFIFIEPDGTDTEADLEKWIQRCLDYNPLAKSSKKKVG